MNEKNKNLLVRVVTAAILLPVVIWITWLGAWPFAVLVALAAAGCAHEMTGIALRRSPLAARVIVVLAAGLVPIAFAPQTAAPSGEVVLAVLAALVVSLWLVNLLFVGEELAPVPAGVGLSFFGIVYTGGLLATVVLLRADPAGFWWIVLVMAATFLNDTGGYFAGRALGRRKLAPRVSPAKTWEGFFGGLAGALIGAVGVVAVSRALGSEVMPALPMSFVVAALGGVLVGAVASVGDLCESLLKRAYAVKDSGKIIPGHGGVLDRLDALLFTGPLVWIWSLFY